MIYLAGRPASISEMILVFVNFENEQLQAPRRSEAKEGLEKGLIVYFIFLKLIKI